LLLLLKIPLFAKIPPKILPACLLKKSIPDREHEVILPGAAVTATQNTKIIEAARHQRSALGFWIGFVISFLPASITSLQKCKEIMD
jgi:hypothetical protein